MRLQKNISSYALVRQYVAPHIPPRSMRDGEPLRHFFFSPGEQTITSSVQRLWISTSISCHDKPYQSLEGRRNILQPRRTSPQINSIAFPVTLSTPHLLIRHNFIVPGSPEMRLVGRHLQRRSPSRRARSLELYKPTQGSLKALESPSFEPKRSSQNPYTFRGVVERSMFPKLLGHCLKCFKYLSSIPETEVDKCQSRNTSI